MSGMVHVVGDARDSRLINHNLAVRRLSGGLVHDLNFGGGTDALV